MNPNIKHLLDSLSIIFTGFGGIDLYVHEFLSLHTVGQEVFFWIGGISSSLWLMARAIVAIKDLFTKKSK